MNRNLVGDKHMVRGLKNTEKIISKKDGAYGADES